MRIVISMGDPAGIGPEVVVKALSDRTLRSQAYFAVIGNAEVLERTARNLGITFPYLAIQSMDELADSNRRVGVIHSVRDRADRVRPGAISALAGRASIEYVEKGVELCIQKKADALVTGPIHKEAIYRGGYAWAGHTELLASATNSPDVVMMMVGGKLRIAMVTSHLPLKDVFRHLTVERIERTIEITQGALRKYFGTMRPLLGVSGFNPHAGDGGRFGKEESERIVPALAQARKKGIRVEGPISPDTIFVHALKGRFDAVVVMYHDQGLIPIKMHAFGRSVNVTLGLPIIRTSVDHGTAFDIVGKGLASASSMKEAIRLALSMAAAK